MILTSDADIPLKHTGNCSLVSLVFEGKHQYLLGLPTRDMSDIFKECRELTQMIYFTKEYRIARVTFMIRGVSNLILDTMGKMQDVLFRNKMNCTDCADTITTREEFMELFRILESYTADS